MRCGYFCLCVNGLRITLHEVSTLLPVANLRPNMLSFRLLILSRQSRPVWELTTSRIHIIHSIFSTMSDRWKPCIRLRSLRHWNRRPSPSNSRNSVIQSLSLFLTARLSLARFWRVGFRIQYRKFIASPSWLLSMGPSSSDEFAPISKANMYPSDLCRFARFCLRIANLVGLPSFGPFGGSDAASVTDGYSDGGCSVELSLFNVSLLRADIFCSDLWVCFCTWTSWAESLAGNLLLTGTGAFFGICVAASLLIVWILRPRLGEDFSCVFFVFRVTPMRDLTLLQSAEIASDPAWWGVLFKGELPLLDKGERSCSSLLGVSSLFITCWILELLSNRGDPFSFGEQGVDLFRFSISACRNGFFRRCATDIFYR